MGALHCTKAIGFLMARSHAHGAVITDNPAFGILRWLTDRAAYGLLRWLT
jgi:hypothetical protein